MIALWMNRIFAVERICWRRSLTGNAGRGYPRKGISDLVQGMPSSINSKDRPKKIAAR